MSQPVVAAVIAAYNRDNELQRLLDSLQSSSITPSVTIVVDNAGLDSTHQLTRQYRTVRYLRSAANIGPGYAWRQGMQLALKSSPLSPTHFLVMDDDVVLDRASLAKLLAAANQSNAGMVAPLLSDHDGRLWGFPEPADPVLRATIRKVTTPAAALERIGDQPQPFSWCTGACVLVAAAAVAKVGYHRTDFFMLGEDLEYSMRVAASFPAVFTCTTTVPHLPPATDSTSAAGRAAGLRKFHALLTNLSYLSYHCPHSSHMRSYLAGNYKRFFATEGLSISTLAQAVTCWWTGAVRGHPAGWRNRIKDESS